MGGIIPNRPAGLIQCHFFFERLRCFPRFRFFVLSVFALCGCSCHFRRSSIAPRGVQWNVPKECAQGVCPRGARPKAFDNPNGVLDITCPRNVPKECAHEMPNKVCPITIRRVPLGKRQIKPELQKNRGHRPAAGRLGMRGKTEKRQRNDAKSH